jgi:putative MATE family efflux protein
VSQTVSPSPPPPPRSLWADLRASLAGEERDWTRIDPRRAVLLLAFPMVLEMVMESVFAVVDVFFVSRLGPAAVATVGLTEAVTTLIFAVALGVSMATTALVARRIGEGDREGASVVAVQAMAIGLGISALFGAAGLLGARHILVFMGATEDVVAIGTPYATILLGGCGSVLLLFLGNAIFRGAGDPAVAVRVLWTGNLINLVLDPCLIFGLGPFPELGLTGAAVATLTGRSVAVLLLLRFLVSGRSRIRIGRGLMRLRREVIAKILRVSRGGIVQYLAETGAWVALIRIVALFGDAALAGYTVAIRIVLFTFLPSWGLSNAAATLVGQHLGAKQPDEAERSVWLTARYNAAFMGSVGLVFLAVPELLLHPFAAGEEVDPVMIATGVDCLRWLGLCYGFFAVGLVTIQAFNGAGDTGTPMRLKLLFYWLIQIPLAWALAVPAGLGPRGVFVAIAAIEAAMAVAAVLLFRRGGWKEKVV